MNSVAVVNTNDLTGIEQVLIQGDLSKLDVPARLNYYKAVCSSVGLNPLTQPFKYIVLNGKLTLYATKDCTEQLRKNHNVSLKITAREMIEGVYVVTANATMPGGRSDESTGAVSVEGLKGESKANALMKAETKAKRRVTLSICGLGMLDETEIETISDARPYVEEPQDAIDSELRDRIESGDGAALFAELKKAVIAAQGKAANMMMKGAMTQCGLSKLEGAPVDLLVRFARKLYTLANEGRQTSKPLTRERGVFVLDDLVPKTAESAAEVVEEAVDAV